MFQKERLWEEPFVKQAPYAQCCQSLGFLFPLLSLFWQSRTDVLMSFLHLNREGNWQFIWTSHPIRKNEREKSYMFSCIWHSFAICLLGMTTVVLSHLSADYVSVHFVFLCSFWYFHLRLLCCLISSVYMFYLLFMLRNERVC